MAISDEERERRSQRMKKINRKKKENKEKMQAVEEKPKMKTYHSMSKGHKLMYKTDEFWPSGKIKKPAQLIEFQNHTYTTSDLEEQGFIENHKYFGSTIRLISEEEHTRFIEEQSKKVMGL